MARPNVSCLTCNGPMPQHQEDFCSLPCKRKFHNRRQLRGAQIYDALMSALEEPGERTASFEERAKALLKKWHDEDVKAGLRRTTRNVYDIGYVLPRTDIEVFKLKTK